MLNSLKIDVSKILHISKLLGFSIEGLLAIIKPRVKIMDKQNWIIKIFYTLRMEFLSKIIQKKIKLNRARLEPYNLKKKIRKKI